jgi:hypothetical protein
MTDERYRACNLVIVHKFLHALGDGAEFAFGTASNFRNHDDEHRCRKGGNDETDANDRSS